MGFQVGLKRRKAVGATVALLNRGNFGSRAGRDPPKSCEIDAEVFCSLFQGEYCGWHGYPLRQGRQFESAWGHPVATTSFRILRLIPNNQFSADALSTYGTLNRTYYLAPTRARWLRSSHHQQRQPDASWCIATKFSAVCGTAKGDRSGAAPPHCRQRRCCVRWDPLAVTKHAEIWLG